LPHLHLIRHAQKSADPDLLTSRSPGVTLPPYGHEQAEALAAALSRLTVARLLCSPLQRAVETATPFSRSTGLTIETEEAFNEMDFGEWTNRRCSELEAVPAWREFNAHRSQERTPGGEGMADVQQRFVAGIEAAGAKQPTGDLVIISHEDPIKSALLHFLNTSLDHWQRLTVAPASISTILIEGATATILRVNHQLDFP